MAEFIDNENVKSAYVKVQQDAIILRENELCIRHGMNQMTESAMSFKQYSHISSLGGLALATELT